MRDQGIDPSTYFKKIKLYPGPIQAMRGLNSNQVDAIAIWGGAFKKNKCIKSCRIIKVLKGLPNPVIVATDKVSRHVRQKLTRGLISLPQTAFDGLSFQGAKDVPEGFYTKAIDSVKWLLSYDKNMKNKLLGGMR